MTWKNSDPEALAAASRSAVRVPFLVASLIEQWRKTFGSSPNAALECSDLQLHYLALCRRPRTANWGDDLAEIAAGSDIAAEKLASFIRAAETAERMSNAHPVETGVDGRLMAARDRDEDD
jgi:hypothetical protein